MQKEYSAFAAKNVNVHAYKICSGIDLRSYMKFIYNIYDPGIRDRGPPPPNGLGPPRRRERSSMLVCVEASQHALHVYIHTHRLYIHTYILTD